MVLVLRHYKKHLKDIEEFCDSFNQKDQIFEKIKLKNALPIYSIFATVIEKDCLEMSKKQLQIELDKIIFNLEKNTDILATMANASPFIGLFGTVWGKR